MTSLEKAHVRVNIPVQRQRDLVAPRLRRTHERLSSDIVERVERERAGIKEERTSIQMINQPGDTSVSFTKEIKKRQGIRQYSDVVLRIITAPCIFIFANYSSSMIVSQMTALQEKMEKRVTRHFWKRISF